MVNGSRASDEMVLVWIQRTRAQVPVLTSTLFFLFCHKGRKAASNLRLSLELPNDTVSGNWLVWWLASRHSGMVPPLFSSFMGDDH